jgi:hypothetical protein
MPGKFRMSEGKIQMIFVESREYLYFWTEGQRAVQRSANFSTPTLSREAEETRASFRERMGTHSLENEMKTGGAWATRQAIAKALG